MNHPAEMVRLKAIVTQVFDAELRAVSGLPVDQRHAAVIGLLRKAANWNSDLHPRDKAGRFISKEKLQAAKSDPELAAELRERVAPKDADKLEAVLSGDKDPGRTRRGEQRHQSRQKRAATESDRRRAHRLAMRAFEPGGLGYDDYEELAGLLPSLTVEQLRAVRSAVGASWGGQRLKRQGMVDTLVAFARQQAAPPEQDAPGSPGWAQRVANLPDKPRAGVDAWESAKVDDAADRAERMGAWEADRPDSEAAGAVAGAARADLAGAKEWAGDVAVTTPKPAAEVEPQAPPEEKPVAPGPSPLNTASPHSLAARDGDRRGHLGRVLAAAGSLAPQDAIDYATADGDRRVTAAQAEIVLSNRLGLGTAAAARAVLGKLKPVGTTVVGGGRKRPTYDVLDLFRAVGKLAEPAAGNVPESGHTPSPPVNSPVAGQSGPDTGGEPNGRGQRLSDEVRGGAGGRGGAGVGAGDGPSPGDAPRASGGSPAGEPAPAGGRPGNRGAGGGPGGGRPGGVAAGGGGAGGGPGGRGPAGGAVPPADGPGGGGGPGRANGGGEISRPANAPLTPAPSQPAAGPAGTATAPATTGGNAAANAPLPALMQPTPYGPQAVVSRGGLVVRDGTGGGGDATGGRSHKLGRMATGRVTRIGPPGERPDAPYMPADSLHRLRDQMRSHLPSAERWTADLPTLLGHPDVPDHLKQQAAPVVAQMEYDRAKTADATRHLKNTPPAQMTRSAFADAVAHADPAEFPDGLYGMFFRSGDLPPGGRSRNGQTRELEAGVSTYPLPRATSLAGLADRPWFFGPGRVVGTGSDDEPLIEPVAEKWTKLAGKGADPAAAFYRWLLQNRPDANTPRDPVK